MSVLKEKSYAFAVRIVKLSKHLNDTHHVYKLSDQILRSGTSIGANIREAEYGQSKLDFIHKLSISLKEANETEYWLNLLKDAGYLEEKLFLSLETDAKELIKMLIASINTTKKNIKNKAISVILLLLSVAITYGFYIK